MRHGVPAGRILHRRSALRSGCAPKGAIVRATAAPQYMTDSADSIEHYAKEHAISIPILTLYEEVI
jgi:hypothetical protein